MQDTIFVECSGGFKILDHLKLIQQKADCTVSMRGNGIGEKTNKCHQCDFASSQSGTLKRHLKTHSREVKWMQSVWLYILSGRQL